jgi:hypothetical protein
MIADIIANTIAGLTPDDIGAVIAALAGLAVAVLAVVEKRRPGTIPPALKDKITAIANKALATFKRTPPAPPEKPLTAGDIAAKKNGKANDYNGV